MNTGSRLDMMNMRNYEHWFPARYDEQAELWALAPARYDEHAELWDDIKGR